MSTYSLTINFYSYDELNDFIAIYNKINHKTEIKTIKSISDKRSSKTVGLHLKAKEFPITHPELSYRNCLIEVSKKVSKPEEPIEPIELIIDEIPEQKPNDKYIDVFETI